MNPCLRIALTVLSFPFAVPLSHGESAATYDETRFSSTILAEKLTRPMELAIAPDGRIFFIELDGALKIWHPDSETVTVAAQLDVFAQQEGGLLGLALDPHFADNQWVYLMYSPPSETYLGQYISRFQMQGQMMDRSSEKILLKVPVHRDECCHHAGSLEFGPRGNLFISTGDNTHPGGDSGGYAPLDERPGRHAYDAQDTAANTDDLRGKILRIRPTPDGGYTVPEGNLFPPDGPISGRPEVYVMGCRNPWRIQVDPKTGYVYWGEVGPDAGGDGPRGPRGYDEVNQARAAGNFGWPYFIADNQPYADHDYTTGETGPLYDVDSPVNDAPSNTGSRNLPKPQPAWIYYPYGASEAFPMMGSGGRTACAGPVYHYDSRVESATKLPQALDNSLIIYDWQRPFIKRVKLDDTSNILAIEPFLTEIPIRRPIDVNIGPTGVLYVLDYGESWGVNEDARLLRIDYFPGNRPPRAIMTAESGTLGRHPFSARLTAQDSGDPDPGDTLNYRWTVHGENFEPQFGENASFTFAEPGSYQVTLTVTDGQGLTDDAHQTFTVGNAPPSLHFLAPVDGGFFEWGDEIPYALVAEDVEDGTSEDAPDFMAMRLLLHHFVASAAPAAAEHHYLSGSGAHARGLSLIQASDCLNCHAVHRRIIGPAFQEIAQRYAGSPDMEAAVRISAERIVMGSSKVWGEVPMLPHAQLSREEAESMTKWIFSLNDPDQKGALEQNFSGTTKVDRPDWDNAPLSGAAVWKATYTDLGGDGVPPLSTQAEVTLRTSLVEAEHFTSKQGTQVLGSETASGGHFIGSVSHGHFLEFDRVNLYGIETVQISVASPETGGRIELRCGHPAETLIAELAFPATGAWDQWQTIETDIRDPGGLHNLCVVFINDQGGDPFMNLDWLRFR